MRPQPAPSGHLAATVHSAAWRRAGARRLTTWLASAAAHIAVLAIAATVSSSRARAEQGPARLPMTDTAIRPVHAAPPLACAAGGPAQASRPWRAPHRGRHLAVPWPERPVDRALSPGRRIERARLTETIVHLDADGGASTGARLRHAGSFDPLLWGSGAPAIDRLGCRADEAPLAAITVLYGPAR